MSRYDEYDVVTFCDICDCKDCPKYGDDCDGKWEEDKKQTERRMICGLKQTIAIRWQTGCML